MIWQPMETAPRNHVLILGKIRDDIDENDSMARYSGFVFTIRHEGKLDSGYDMGWGLMRTGIGGVDEKYIAGWMHIP